MQSEETVAAGTFAELTLLEDLRTSYVAYWQQGQLAARADELLSALDREPTAAQGLVHSGFWTQQNMLDFRATIAGAQSDLDGSKAQAAAQLHAISSILGEPLLPATPQDPTLAGGCTPQLDRAAASAGC